MCINIRVTILAKGLRWACIQWIGGKSKSDIYQQYLFPQRENDRCMGGKQFYNVMRIYNNQ